MDSEVRIDGHVVFQRPNRGDRIKYFLQGFSDLFGQMREIIADRGASIAERWRDMDVVHGDQSCLVKS